MNRKIFISLIALPLIMLFISSIMIGASGPEKARQGQSAQNIAAHQAQALQQSSTQLDKMNCIRIEKEKELKGAMHKAQAQQIAKNGKVRAYKNNDPFIYQYDNRIEERFAKLVQKNVIFPLKRARVENYSGKIFSRCPSGYNFRMVQVPAKVKAWVNGEILHRDGCMKVVYASFRIEKNTGQAEILISNEYGYVSVNRWIEIRKSA